MKTPVAFEVIGLGAATVDDLWLVDEFHSTEGVWKSSGHARMGGGPVASALAVLAHFGTNTALVDVCGDDEAGRWLFRDFERLNVDTCFLQKQPGHSTARAIVLVRQGDGARQIHYLPSSAGEPILTKQCRAAIAAAKILHLNGRHDTVAVDAAQVAREAGTLISFDGGAGRYRAELRPLVEAADLRIVSREFAARYAGSDAIELQMSALSQVPARVVVVTDGAHGSYGLDSAGGIHHQPAHPVCPGLVDTTGCGDVYHGAFLHGWLQGWGLERCMEFASRLAALNASGLGGRFVCTLEPVAS